MHLLSSDVNPDLFQGDDGYPRQERELPGSLSRPYGQHWESKLPIYDVDSPLDTTLSSVEVATPCSPTAKSFICPLS